MIFKKCVCFLLSFLSLSAFVTLSPVCVCRVRFSATLSYWTSWKGQSSTKRRSLRRWWVFFFFFFMIILLHAFTDTNSSLILTKSLNEQIFIVSSIQVSEAQIEATMAQSPGSQLSLKRGMKSSYDSGALSLDTTDQTVWLNTIWRSGHPAVSLFPFTALQEIDFSSSGFQDPVYEIREKEDFATRSGCQRKGNNNDWHTGASCISPPNKQTKRFNSSPFRWSLVKTTLIKIRGKRRAAKNVILLSAVTI